MWFRVIEFLDNSHLIAYNAVLTFGASWRGCSFRIVQVALDLNLSGSLLAAAPFDFVGLTFVGPNEIMNSTVDSLAGKR